VLYPVKMIGKRAGQSAEITISYRSKRAPIGPAGS
jgi:hypothetical protein